MKRSFRKRRLAAFLAAVLVFSVCPEVSFEQGKNGNVKVCVEANGPEKVWADTDPEPYVTLSSDWVSAAVSDDKICLSGYKGSETVIKIPAIMTSGDSTYNVELVGLQDPDNNDCKAADLTSITLESGVIIKVYDTADPYDESYVNHELFRGLTNLTEVNASGVKFDGDSLGHLFRGCTSLNKADLSQWDLNEIKQVNNMFSDCSALETVNLYDWQNMGFTNCYYMFANCVNLTTIYADWDMTQIPNLDTGSDVFTNSYKLVGGKGSTCNSGYVSAMYGRPDERDNGPGYFTLKQQSGDPEPPTEQTYSLSIGKLSYSFANSFDGLKYNDPYRIPESRFIDVFGNKGSFMHYFYNDEWGGSCYGLSGTSSLINVSGNDIDLSDYDNTANAVKDLCITQADSPTQDGQTLDELKKFIEEDQISQFDVRVQLCYIFNTGVNDTLNTVKNEPYPVIIGLFGPEGGHAVLAYSVQEISATEARIHIYDSNWPMEDCYITATRSGDSGNWTEWYYDLGGREGKPSLIWGNNPGLVTDSARRGESDITFIPYDVYSMTYMDRGYYNDADWLISNSDSTVWTVADEEAYLDWVWTKADEAMYREYPWTQAEEMQYLRGETISEERLKYRMKYRLKYRLKSKLNYRMEERLKTIVVKDGDAVIKAENGTSLATVNDGKLHLNPSTSDKLFAFRSVDLINPNNTSSNSERKANTPMYTPADEKTTFENTGTGQPLEIAMMDDDRIAKVSTNAAVVTGNVNASDNKSEIQIKGRQGDTFDMLLTKDGTGTEITLEGKLTEDSQAAGGTGLTLVDGKLNAENVELKRVEVKSNSGDYDSDSGTSISECNISITETMRYTGEKVYPNVSVRRGGSLLEEWKDYVVSYSDNTEVGIGTAKVTITGIGGYRGKVERTFTITRNGSGTPVTPTYGYTPSISLPEHGTITVSTKEPRANDTVTITITSEEGFEVKEVIVKDIHGNPVEVTKNADGTYSFIQPSDGAVSISADIVRKDEKPEDFVIGFAELTDDPYEGVCYNDETRRYETVYTGEVIKPLIKVMSETAGVLKEGVDYTVSYSNNKDVSKKNPAKISINGKENYTGSHALELYIIPVNLKTAKSKGLLTMAEEVKVVSGKKADPVMLYGGLELNGRDRTINNNPADSTIDIAGIGNFTGELKDIPVKTITNAEARSNTIKVSLKAGSHVYNGKANELTVTSANSIGELTVTAGSSKTPLIKDKDFIVLYGNNINAGTAKVTVIGTGDKFGTVKKSFKIEAARNAEITAALADPDTNVQYTVKGATPKVTVKAAFSEGDGKTGAVKELVNGRDYKVTYSSNKKVGNGSYNITLLGNYRGHKAVKGSFKIGEAPIDSAVVEAVQMPYKNPGKYLAKPYVSLGHVQLKTSDYTVKYYEGEVSDITASGVKELTSRDVLKLDKDETSKTITVAVTGKGNYTGMALGTYEVVRYNADKIDLSKAKIVAARKDARDRYVSVGQQEYNGKAIEPEIKILVKQGKDWKEVDASYYSVCYINNLNMGRALILVNGDGVNAIGSKNTSFSITGMKMNLFRLLFKYI